MNSNSSLKDRAPNTDDWYLGGRGKGFITFALSGFKLRRVLLF